MSTRHHGRSLGEELDHPIVPLAFGTSGRRGRLVDLTQLEIFINALAELRYLQTLSETEGGIRVGDILFYAADLRPSSTTLDAEGRGELAQAIEFAIQSAGMTPVYLGKIPTPALTAYALSQGKGSMMVTGSHIPFDRNGYKTNTSKGELLKSHEPPIHRWVEAVRQEVYGVSYDISPFNAKGAFKEGSRALPPEDMCAKAFYVQRYLDFLGPTALQGLKVLVYQHSAVGRDLLVELLTELGAKVIPAGRSDQFVPIDTENVDSDRLVTMQQLIDEAIAVHGSIDALVSTDGDSDRPLILAVDSETGQGRFFGGDLVGMVTAMSLRPDAVVVPISCNDAIDASDLAEVLEDKTRIGSPYVIEGMQQAQNAGKHFVCGFEANGGFLLQTDFFRGTKKIAALPTRDAVLPIVLVLAEACSRGVRIEALFDALPARYSKASLVKDFPRWISSKIIASVTPARLDSLRVNLDAFNRTCWAPILSKIVSYFPIAEFGTLMWLDYTDGLRMGFDQGDVIHLRPSGNADEFRVYAVSNAQSRANVIAQRVSEDGGIFSQMRIDMARS